MAKTLPYHSSSGVWIGRAGGLWETFPAVAEGVLKRIYPYVLPFKQLAIPVAVLSGRARLGGTPAAVAVAGTEPWAGCLLDDFFEETPARKSIGAVPLWELPRVIRDLRQWTNLTILRLDRISASFFPERNCLRVPEWVGMSMPVPQHVSELRKRSRSVEEDLRVIRRDALVWDVTGSEQDFLTFYHTMYVPHVRARYGQRAVIRRVATVRRWFNRGALVRVRRDGEFVAGGVFFIHGSVLHCVALGITAPEARLGKSGAIAAIYLAVIEMARQFGCASVNFGGCRPSLNDGLLRYKRKWGMKVSQKWDTFYDLLVYWNRFDECVASFLTGTPLVFRHRGVLSAVTAISASAAAPEDVWSAYRSMWLPGLERLYIASRSDWQSVHDVPPQTTLVHTGTGSWTPARLLSCA